MAGKKYALTFRGYWRAPNAGGLPNKSGIYCVYACTYNEQEKTVTLRELLYIGESVNIRDRVDGHERWEIWKLELQWNEVLCFNAAVIEPRESRLRVEAAMIYEHRPTSNWEFIDSFPYNKTTVITRGRNALLHNRFTAPHS